MYLGLHLGVVFYGNISVPSTEKWSELSSRFMRGCERTAFKSFAATSPSNSRSRFSENVE